ncbi:MAG: hypothetical protein ACSHX7_08845 [Luteolibacter sp.]
MSRINETLKESMSQVTDSTDFSYAIRNFLDRFKSNPSSSLLTDEPALLSPSLNDGGYADAFLASTAAYLCQVHNLKAPAWVNTSCRKMPVPYFAAKTPNMKAILLQESPAAFRVRNLFVSANALSRA